MADGVVYAGCGKDGHIYAFLEVFGQAPTGGEKGIRPDKPTRMIWQYDTGGTILSSPSVSDGLVFIGSDSGFLFAFGLPQ